MIEFLLPLLVAALTVSIAGVLKHRLPPPVAVRSLAVTCLALAATVTWALLAVVVGAFSEPGAGGHRSGWWWPVPTSDAHMPPWAGSIAGAVLILGIVRAGRSIVTEHRARRRLPSCEAGILVVDSPEPFAYAVPGRRGGVVVSTGMIDALEPAERTVMWAHEQSHLGRHHGRYLVVTEVAVAIVPPLCRLVRHVRFATERWADEDAAVLVGDRGLVARAIARAALASVDHRRSAMALADTGVGARVRALVEVDEGSLAPTAGTAAGILLIASTIVGSALQLHHFVVLLDHIG